MRRLVVLTVLAAALAGCGLKSLYVREPEPRPLEGEWGELRIAATRRAVLYDGLDHRATATATHLGLPEREARARRLGAWLGWTPEELEKRLATERAEAAQNEEFLVSLYTANRMDNDLDSPRGSVWRLAVVVDGAELVSTRAQAIDADATVKGLFPYVGGFETVYRVRFPLAPQGPLSGRTFVLEMASALGKMRLDYGAPQETPANAPLEQPLER